MEFIIVDYWYTCIFLKHSLYFNYVTTVDEEADWPPLDEKKVIVMKLKVRCRRNPSPPEGATTPVDLYTDAHGIMLSMLIACLPLVWVFK